MWCDLKLQVGDTDLHIFILVKDFALLIPVVVKMLVKDRFALGGKKDLPVVSQCFVYQLFEYFGTDHVVWIYSLSDIGSKRAHFALEFGNLILNIFFIGWQKI